MKFSSMFFLFVVVVGFIKIMKLGSCHNVLSSNIDTQVNIYFLLEFPQNIEFPYPVLPWPVKCAYSTYISNSPFSNSLH